LEVFIDEYFAVAQGYVEITVPNPKGEKDRRMWESEELIGEGLQHGGPPLTSAYPRAIYSMIT
jgi:hypothetical protein